MRERERLVLVHMFMSDRVKMCVTKCMCVIVFVSEKDSEIKQERDICLCVYVCL